MSTPLIYVHKLHLFLIAYHIFLCTYVYITIPMYIWIYNILHIPKKIIYNIFIYQSYHLSMSIVYIQVMGNHIHIATRLKLGSILHGTLWMWWESLIVNTYIHNDKFVTFSMSTSMIHMHHLSICLCMYNIHIKRFSWSWRVHTYIYGMVKYIHIGASLEPYSMTHCECGE